MPERFPAAKSMGESALEPNNQPRPVIVHSAQVWRHLKGGTMKPSAFFH